MSYLELLKLASPEAIVTLTALVVLAIGVASERGTVVAGVSPAKPQERAAGTAASTVVCTLVAVAGLIVAITAIVMLPPNADLFRGMLVISPLNSLFKIVCLVLALLTIPLASRETSNYGEYLAMILLGFAFKIAAAPFHLWAPDAYQGAPVSSAAFIASGSKVASFVVLGKIMLVGFSPIHGSADWHAMVVGWSPVLAMLAAFSILLGNLVALVQTNLRRLLAYSAVAHAGYTLLGLIAGGREGFGATLFYTTIYAFTLLGAFGVVALVRRETGGDDLQNFAGLSARSPLLAGCMAVFMLSLAGLPPLAGFFGKFYLFSVAFGAGPSHGLLWLVVVALFGSLISLYYYLIVLKLIFQTQNVEKFTASPIAHSALPRVTIALAAAIVLCLGIAPQFLVSRIIAALP